MNGEGEEDEKELYLTNCCGANFTTPGWPDSDICSECGEHADIEHPEEPENKHYRGYATYLKRDSDNGAG